MQDTVIEPHTKPTFHDLQPDPGALSSGAKSKWLKQKMVAGATILVTLISTIQPSRARDAEVLDAATGIPCDRTNSRKNGWLVSSESPVHYLCMEWQLCMGATIRTIVSVNISLACSLALILSLSLRRASDVLHCECEAYVIGDPVT